MTTMILLGLLSLVACLVPLRYSYTATAFSFSLAPRLGRSTARIGGNGYYDYDSALCSLPKNQNKLGFKSFSSSISKPAAEDDGEQQADTVTPPSTPKNDLSMFLKQDDDDDDVVSGEAELEFEFFVTKDESIQRLEEVEEFFRNEPQGIMMEEKEGILPVADRDPGGDRVVPSRNPDILVAHNHNNQRIGTIKMTDNHGIGVDEDRPTKKLMQYYYEGTLSKIKRNLYRHPLNDFFD